MDGWMYVCVCMYVCLYVRMYVRTYVCMYVCVERLNRGKTSIFQEVSFSRGAISRLQLIAQRRGLQS